ncbi:transposable element Tcb2 transposase [Trichonephila clavipes]|nr:transposable element Tcb2 transposase [Trichonephila clavipes]
MPLRRFRRQYEQLSQFERGRIIVMMEAEWSARRIARQLGHSDCVVRRCWDQWIREMSFTRRLGSGRPRQTSHREDRHIVRNARVQPTASSAAIQAQWCRARGNWTAVEWNQVVFSDESRFILSSADNRVRLWRPRGERFNPAFALQRLTAPTAGVMVWGVIVYNTRVSQNCLYTVTTLPWPAQSPDLSPIEHMWDHLGRRVGHPMSLNELEARLPQIWNEMSQDIIQNMYASMPDRIASCIRCTEGSTGDAISDRHALSKVSYELQQLFYEPQEPRTGPCSRLPSSCPSTIPRGGGSRVIKVSDRG